MRIEPELGSVSIILIGKFNPNIFTPGWLAHWGLIPEQEALVAEASVVAGQFAQCVIGSRTITVEPERFTIEKTEAPWVDASDLVVRAFTEFLSHTPIFKIGINRMVHFSVGSEDTRHQIGRWLAPIEPWGEWGKEIGNSTPKSGCVTLSMQKPWLKDDFRGYLQTTLQPSVRIPGNVGIYMLVNSHCEVISPAEVLGGGKIMNYLHDEFQNCIDKSEWIIDQIMALKEKVVEE